MAFVITETLVIFDHRFRKLQLVANLCTDDFPDAATAYAAAPRTLDGLIEACAAPALRALLPHGRAALASPCGATPPATNTRAWS